MLGGVDVGVVVAGGGGGVVVAGVAGVVAVVGTLTVFFLSLLNTPPIARPATMSAISTTAASAYHGAFEPPV
jgi:hypothetical protein